MQMLSDKIGRERAEKQHADVEPSVQSFTPLGVANRDDRIGGVLFDISQNCLYSVVRAPLRKASAEESASHDHADDPNDG